MRGFGEKKVAIVALNLVCAAAMAQEAVITKSGLEVRDSGKAARQSVPGSVIQWAPSGKLFFVSDEAAGSVTVCSPKGDTLATYSDARNPRWSGDAKSLLVLTHRGLAVIPAQKVGEAKIVATDPKGSASFSPDGTRIAFGAKGGLCVSDLSSPTPHLIAKGHSATSTDWSSELDVIAFIDEKGYLLVVRPNGSGLHQITKLDATELRWSPNGRWLLAKCPDGWVAIQPGEHKMEPVVCDPTAFPTWTGGQKLLVVQQGIPRKLFLGAHNRDESGDKLREDVRFYASRPQFEISNDSLTQSAFRGARRPDSGDLRLTGYIETADAMDGKYTVRVESTTDPEGREMVFANAVAQRVDWFEGATQSDGRHSRSLQPGDVRDDDRVTLIVHARKLDAASSLPLREAWIEGQGVGQDYGSDFFPNIGGAPHLQSPNIEYDGITREKVVVPMVFPVAGKVWWEDWFLASRGGGSRRHHGQDLMAKKMTPLVACFDGVVRLGRSKGISGFSVSLDGDNGYRAFYCHINNDTPGTNDCKGGDDTAFAPGLVSGMHVKAGQFIAYVGNSGNAKTTDPHCHFELKDMVSHAIINAAPSLRAAIKLNAPAIQSLPGSTDEAPQYLRMRPLASRGGFSRRAQVSSATMQYWPIMQKYGQLYHVDPALIAAVTQQESDGNPVCVSSAGAMGLMQLMPDNCREYGVEDPYSPEDNIRGGVAQLADHLKRFGGDIQKALIAYNAGPGRVLDGSWTRIAETRNYIPKVLGYYQSLKGQAYPIATEPDAPMTAPAPKVDRPIQFKSGTYVAPPPARIVGSSLGKGGLHVTIPGAQHVDALDSVAQKVAQEYAHSAHPQESIKSELGNWTRQAGFQSSSVILFTTSIGEKFEDKWRGRNAAGCKVGLACQDMGGIQYWAVVLAK